MASHKARGSLIYEILIVILLLLLLGTILYPKSVWEQIDKDTRLSRENMKMIVDAEILYLQAHPSHSYDSSLVDMFTYIHSDSIWGADTTLHAIRDTFYVKLMSSYLENYMGVGADAARDSVYALLRNRAGMGNESTIDDIVSRMIDLVKVCPTAHDNYHIEVVDTSAIKVLKVRCPIDQSDIDSINSDFLFRVLGGGKVENHGYIDNNEFSWKEGDKK